MSLDESGNMRYEGVIKSFNPERGWGHIECAELFEQYGKDVFLLKSQLIGITVVQKGQMVSFNVTDNGRGPEAASVQALQGLVAAPAQTFSPMPQPDSSAGLGGSFIGTVKSFNPTSGWGHISCQQTEQIYGKDMFFLKSQLPHGSIMKGAQVQFSVTQGMKGPEATSIQVIGGQPGPIAPAQMMYQQAQAQQRMTGPAAPPGGVIVGGCMGGGMAGNGQVFYGTVKTFNEEKGWGHISCTQTQAIYGKDMFVLRSALNNVPVSPGDMVQFSVTMGRKGPEAANVQVLGQGAEQRIFTGTVKKWDEEKGWGFLQSDESRSLYQKDIFLHKKDINGYAPSPGEQVQFCVRISPAGRPEATGVQFFGGAVPAPPSYGAWKGVGPSMRPGPW